MLIFDIGIVVMVVGILVYMIPLLDKVALPVIDLLGLWTAFNLLPAWLQISAAGVFLCLSALLVGTLKQFTSNMVDEVFRGRDDF